jgi:hypothetical protein
MFVNMRIELCFMKRLRKSRDDMNCISMKACTQSIDCVEALACTKS